MSSPVHKVSALAAQRRPSSRKSISHPPTAESLDDALGKENLTTDLGVVGRKYDDATSGQKAMKKSRSKSIGPGGLDALTEGSGNRRKSSMTIAIKSILKPTVPLSPLKEIPSLSSMRKPTTQGHAAGYGAEGDSGASTTDFGHTMSAKNATGPRATSEGPVTSLALPTVPSGAGHETANNARSGSAPDSSNADEAELQRSQAIERRDARRKSLANRRVSFAPEATLHTWDVIEYMQDSTTSSSSTNSTRRASSMTAGSAAASPRPSTRSAASTADASDSPSTPASQTEEPAAVASPAHQRNLHQKKRRRRSSTIPPMNFNNPADEGSSPLSAGSSMESDDGSGQEFVDGDADDASESEGSTDEGESSVMMVDDEDTTVHSVGSARSRSSTTSSGRLDAALEQAAAQAGTHGIEYDEHGDLTMEMADNEITAAFQPWMQRAAAATDPVQQVPRPQQEKLNPFSPAFKAAMGSDSSRRRSDQSTDGDDMSMDMTSAVGAILSTPRDPAGQAPAPSQRRRSVAARSRRSIAGRRHSFEEGSSQDDQTMDLTTAVGGIRAKTGPDELDAPSDLEDMTMELTSVWGAVRPGSAATGLAPSDPMVGDESAMDMTVAGGGILASIAELPESTEELKASASSGAIAKGASVPDVNTPTRRQAKVIMERETESGDMASSPFQAVPTINTPVPIASPLAPHDSSRNKGRGKTPPRKSMAAGSTPSLIARSPPKSSSTPTKKPATPVKQLTPRPTRPVTPTKTPPSKNISFRSSSPKRLFTQEIRHGTTTTPTSALTPARSLFQPSELGTHAPPTIVLPPRSRRTSGVGADKEGLGSPRVAAMLDRRQSIGEAAPSFALGAGAHDPSRLLRFDDPRTLAAELARDDEEEQQRQQSHAGRPGDGGRTLASEEKDATLTLKEMIQSLTPKKKVKGRKSLHVGAAKGLLGKRPAELDQDGDTDEESPKRAKGPDGSPVKNVLLRPPPSKIETTGRATGVTRKSLVEGSERVRALPTMAGSPLKTNAVSASQGPDHDHISPRLASPGLANASGHGSDETMGPDPSPERIHLQAFLDLTSIRFMELNTTKRRHTLAPKTNADGLAGAMGHDRQWSGGDDGATDLGRCVIAGACTMPMLELYQHSCRELKRYISEGRSIVREIEADTFEENPPLFREYLSASPDVRFIMDNQFRNVKTHARLLSKAMWYEWRMKLLDGLKEGLCKIGDGMEGDELVLAAQERLVAPLLPPLLAEQERLAREETVLDEQAHELANCDQDELDRSRERMLQTEAAVSEQRRVLAELQAQMHETEASLVTATTRASTCLAEIDAAERIREACRGWTCRDVESAQARVAALQQASGWTITSVAGRTLTMVLHGDLQLTLDPTAAAPAPNVVYLGASEDGTGRPGVAETRFVLEQLQAQLAGRAPSALGAQALVAFVSRSWAPAAALTEETRRLNLCCPTEASVVSERSLSIQSTLLLPTLATKVTFTFAVMAAPREAELALTVQPQARVVYGEALNEARMGAFLSEHVSRLITGDKGEARGSWATAVHALSEKLVARGKK
ncbi:MAG: hypothetical protein M1838_000317 [Thelocarpon superellum]|nr:MAG: hypothetical protein M1838_000317 [Thelocarpon superellum]